MTVVLSGQVSELVRSTDGGNSTVIVLPAAVSATLPANLRLGADFGTADIRVAVFNDTAGWRVYDPYVVNDGDIPVQLNLEAGDSKLSVGRDSGTGQVGWTVTTATA